MLKHREFKNPPTGRLGRLKELGLLDYFEQELKHFTVIAIREAVSSLEKLDKESPELHNLSSADWDWAWGGRFIDRTTPIEVRCFRSQRIFQHRSLGKNKQLTPFGDEIQRVIISERGEVRVSYSLGVDNPDMGGLIIRVQTLEEGDWIEALKSLAAAWLAEQKKPDSETDSSAQSP